MQISEKLTLKEVAAFLKADYRGDENLLVTGINEIHKVREGDLTFVDFEKYYNKALTSKASVIIINKQVESANGKGLIFSEDPFRDFNKLSNKFAPFISCDRQICKSARIGEGTIIQPGVFIGQNVQIGKNCLIHSNVSINAGTIIEDRVTIHSGAVIGADAFYYKTRHQNSGSKYYDKLLSSGKVVIKSDVEIGASSTVDRGVSGDTIIGEGTKIDNLVHVGHGVEIGKNCLFAAQVGIGGKVIIEDEVILWGQVGVSKDIRIGKGAEVYAQSGIAKSLPGNKKYFGSPAREAKSKMREMAMISMLTKHWNKLLKLIK